MDKIVMRHNASVTLNRKEKPATLDQWREKAENLWKLLDDIDTYGDMFKPEHTIYFKKVNEKANQRHDILSSDGYNIINVNNA